MRNVRQHNKPKRKFIQEITHNHSTHKVMLYASANRCDMFDIKSTSFLMRENPCTFLLSGTEAEFLEILVCGL